MTSTRPTPTRPARSRGTERWTPAETLALLQAVEPLGQSSWPSCTVSLHDRVVEIALDPTGWAGPPPHSALVRCGQLVGSLENTLRGLGWAVRLEIAGSAAAAPLVVVRAGRRRPATPLDLARHRVARRAREGAGPPDPAPVDGSRVVDVAHAAGTRGGWLHLVNGPTRDGTPAWHPPGTVPPDDFGLALPWTREPVLAVCTDGDGDRDAVVGGLVLHRGSVESGLRGLRTEVHLEPFDAPAVRARAVPGSDVGPVERGTAHGLLHLHH